MKRPIRAQFPIIIIFLLIAIGVVLMLWPRTNKPIEISILYSPEGDPFMPEVIETFNDSFARGINPVTGAWLAAGERPIRVTGESVSSGTTQQGIINAIIAPEHTNVATPTIFSPSTSMWLSLVNQATRREIFNLKESPATSYGAVVIAIWESRLKAIQAKHPNQPIGWEELLVLINSPRGWADYGIAGRPNIYYGHTNPYVSSTGLATLIAEFNASARANGGANAQLSQEMVNNPAVQQGVREIESVIKHYSERMTEMREYIGQGPEYVDFIAMQEDTLIYINNGKNGPPPPEKLVALYPKEGTFWFDHPFAIPNADWVSPEQREAAGIFTQYVLSKEVQEKVMTLGLLRPANPEVPLDYPYVSELGIDPQQKVANGLPAPSADVISAVQTSWQYVKKQADIVLTFDTSGSMSGEKLEQAKQAMKQFVEQLPIQNRVALLAFNQKATLVMPFVSLEENKEQLLTAIQNLQANGDTALYDGVIAAAKLLAEEEKANRIRAIVLLSDGEDTASQQTLHDILTLSRGEKNPWLLFPVGYGSDANISVLNTLAQFSQTRFISGEPESIGELLRLFSSYF